METIFKKVSNEKKKTNDVLDNFKNYINQKEINHEEAVNMLTYGFEIIKLDNQGHFIKYIFFLSHFDKKIIEYVKKEAEIVGRIDLSKITEVEFGASRGVFSKLSPENRMKFKSDLSLSIFLNSESHDLIFNDTNQINQFCSGMYHIWQEEIDEEINLSNKNANIKKIWNKYDKDHSGQLDVSEFVEFLKEIRFNITRNFTVEELFRKVDQDNSGKIEFHEFVKYFEELTSGKEFSNVFNNYSNEGQMDIYQLMKFQFEVQNQTFKLVEAIKIILNYNDEISDLIMMKIKDKVEKNINDLSIDYFDETETKCLYLKMKHFQTFMNDPFYNNALNFYDQSMDFPTNDYFIYSSHNTYLRGHQLYGESSVEMYAYAISLGCRCVEIDCWDGKNNEPKITHGLTFTSDILLKDVLKLIKESAFKLVDSPFIISVEMHCGQDQQKIMASYFKTILVDTWIPEQDGMPISYPSPNELKRKFIIKCKRPRVFRNEIENIQKKKRIQEGNQYDLSKKSQKLINFQKKESIQNKETIQLSKSTLDQDNDTEEKKKIAIEYLKEKKRTIKEVVHDLYFYIGLIIIDLNVDKIEQLNFQPWDIGNLSESKVLNLYHHKRDKLIDFTSNSFLRVYPKGTRIGSSNYDPVKNWICGAQIVSLNVQSLEDDYTLLNHIFFKNNKETGYVLKPSYLRNNPYEFKNYMKPVFKLEFRVLSGIMLQKCMKENSSEIYVSVQVIGTYEDDKNAFLKTESVKHNFLHPIFKENKAIFSIYESELSFLLIKMFDNKGIVLARSVIPMMCLMEGYRSLTLYDNNCQLIENSILIIFSTKF